MDDELGNVTDVRDGANREIRSRSPRIKTLDQLLKECKVNLKTWIVERYVVNKWEVGAKDDGGNIVVEPLFQVKAWLVRKRPEVVEITIPAAEVKIPSNDTLPYTNLDGVRRTLHLTDIHAGFRRDLNTGVLDPFHDRGVLDIALQLAQRLQFNHIVIGGDTIDANEWSDKFIKEPEFYWTTKPALLELSWFFGRLRVAAPHAKIDVIEGNHCIRLSHAVIKYLPAAYQLRPDTQVEYSSPISLPALTGMRQMNITWIGGYPNAVVWLADGLAAVHGDVARGNPGATAWALIEKATHSTIFGHIHRREIVSRTIDDHHGIRTITGACPGCMCRVDGVVPGHNPRRQNWQQGIGVAYHTDKKLISYDIIPIENGKAYYQGNHYRARDGWVEQLRAATDWEF